MEKGNILLVDDETDIKNVIKRGLEISGFKVKPECDALLALSNFRQGLYDLVILDLKMPNMNGFELYEKMFKIDNKIKVCFVTAFDVEYFEEFKKRFPNVPIRCFIKKPVSISSLISMVKQELSHTAEA